MSDGETPRDARYLVAGNALAAPPLAPGLHVVATPIGNLRDITLRALETLAAADVVLCEDTRTSAKLLDHYGIRTPRSPLHEHNERARIEGVLADIAAGRAIALISDAGTPLISDPGFPLVRAVQEAGLPVFAVPGASSVLAALSVAGLPTDRFTFVGFLPSKQEAREKAIVPYYMRRETLVFLESPRRLADTLAAMARQLDYERQAVVALELTKRFERVYRGTLTQLSWEFGQMEEVKGEAVILVAGAPEEEAGGMDWMAALTDALESQPLRNAVDFVAESYGIKRKEVYDAALRLKSEKS